MSPLYFEDLEIRGESATGQIAYVNVHVGTDRVARLQLSLTDGGSPSATQREYTTTDDYKNTTVYVPDHLGSTYVTAHGPNRKLTFFTLDPHGGDLLQNGYWPLGSTETPYRLIGHERDESGLYEMGARQYDPGIGRWLTPDPLFIWSPQKALESPREQNLYAYVKGNPIRLKDPSGLEAAWISTDPFKQPGERVSDRISAANIVPNARALLRVAAEVTIAPIRAALTLLGAENVANSNAPGKPLAASKSFVSQLVEVAGAALLPGAVRGVVKALGKGSGASEKVVREVAETSRAARREAMRQAGIPTTKTPVSASKNQSGREYSYEVPKPGGGTQRMSVQQQTMDRSHRGQPHWEAGPVKVGDMNQVRQNKHGWPKLESSKSKVEYPGR